MEKIYSFKEFEDNQKIEEGWKEMLIAGAITFLSGSAAKATNEKPIDISKADTAAYNKSKGTLVDGVIGYYTSQFVFGLSKKETITNINDRVTKDSSVNTGIAGNKALMSKAGKITPEQLKEWNDFQAWMKSKGYAGNPSMNNVKFSNSVLSEYLRINPNFWVKGADDVKIVQALIKAFRAWTVEKWKNTILDEEGNIVGEKVKGIGTGKIVNLDGSVIPWSNQAEAIFIPWAK